jgi:hypothetical protein
MSMGLTKENQRPGNVSSEEHKNSMNCKGMSSPQPHCIPYVSLKIERNGFGAEVFPSATVTISEGCNRLHYFNKNAFSRS